MENTLMIENTHMKRSSNEINEIHQMDDKENNVSLCNSNKMSGTKNVVLCNSTQNSQSLYNTHKHGKINICAEKSLEEWLNDGGKLLCETLQDTSIYDCKPTYKGDKLFTAAHADDGDEHFERDISYDEMKSKDSKLREHVNLRNTSNIYYDMFPPVSSYSAIDAEKAFLGENIKSSGGDGNHQLSKAKRRKKRIEKSLEKIRDKKKNKKKEGIKTGVLKIETIGLTKV